LPEGEVGVELPSGKWALQEELKSSDIDVDKPLINLYSHKSNIKPPSFDEQNVVLRTDFPLQSATSPCVTSTVLPSDPLFVAVPYPDVVSSSFANTEIYGKDSFDIIEKDLKVPSYSVRLFKDRPSPVALSSSPADVHHLHINFEDTDRDVIRMDYAPAKPQRESAISEKDKRADGKIGMDEIDGTSQSPNAFMSPSAEMYSASASPREVRAYPSSSDITASELESSSQGESMPISPRDFYAHSATPEFKRITDAEVIEEEGNIKKKNMFNWFHLSWRRNKRRKSAVSTSSGVEDGRSPSTTGKRKPKHHKHKERKPTTEDEDLGIQADIALVAIPTTEVVPKVEPALPREAELILAEQKSATTEAQAEASKSRESKGLFPKKRSKKHKKVDQVTPTSSTKFETAPRMRQPSSSTPSECQLRQTWHHSEMKVSPISEVDRRTPPPPPIPRHLDDEISEWLARAYRSHYAEGSPLRKPRPWSTLDFPPRNCTFLNDDYLFPYSITPTKLPSCQWKSDKEYNVPYIDDDALPLDEPEWALGESRRTLTLTSADADFWRSAIAEEEKSDASGEGAWGLKKHSKKYRSLIPFHHKDRSSKEQDVIRRPRLLNPPTDSPSQGFRKKVESTQHQEPPQTHY
uniref:Ras-GEF domain-containing protein n=1 Tax=Hymenolepis diminuta TaxID=6216 RepID=A0A0R3SLW9_HYMDI